MTSQTPTTNGFTFGSPIAIPTPPPQPQPQSPPFSLGGKRQNESPTTEPSKKFKLDYPKMILVDNLSILQHMTILSHLENGL